MSSLPQEVVAAFAWAGEPLPAAERVDRLGYTFREVSIIERHRRRLV